MLYCSGAKQPKTGEYSMSKLKDLKEMSIKEWDGMPFKAYVDDGSKDIGY